MKRGAALARVAIVLASDESAQTRLLVLLPLVLMVGEDL